MKAPRVSSWIRATGPEFGFAEIVLESTPNHLYNDRRPVPPRGAFHDRRERWARDAVDAALPPRAYARGRTACSGRRSRVVLTPGCWRQVPGRLTPFGGDGVKRLRFTRESTI